MVGKVERGAGLKSRNAIRFDKARDILGRVRRREAAGEVYEAVDRRDLGDAIERVEADEIDSDRRRQPLPRLGAAVDDDATVVAGQARHDAMSEVACAAGDDDGAHRGMICDRELWSAAC